MKLAGYNVLSLVDLSLHVTLKCCMGMVYRTQYIIGPLQNFCPQYLAVCFFIFVVECFSKRVGCTVSSDSVLTVSSCDYHAVHGDRMACSILCTVKP